MMFVTIINDCRDANVFGRQATRAALFGCTVNPVAVADELEAAETSSTPSTPPKAGRASSS